jgi:cell division protein FtsW (lipid II flippase)
MYASYARKSLDILKPVVYINIVLFTIWMMTTYSVLLENSHAARYVIRSDDEAKAFAMRGVGGFSFVYSLLIYIIAVLGLIKHKIKQKKLYNIWTFFMIFSVIMAILVVLKAEYSTAVLLMVLSLIFFFFHSNSLKKNIIMMVVMILVFIALEYYVIDILKAILPYTEGTNYYHKVLDSIHSINAGEATGTAADRTERYLRSLYLFLDNPLIGVWSFTAVGKHSLILDTFAQFGILGGIALLYILLKVPIQLYKYSRVDKTVPLAVIFLIIALSALNNVSMAYGFMFYIFYPAIWQRIEDA